MVLEKTLESPLNFKEIKPVNPKGNQYLKEINPEYSLEGLMLKLKLQYLSHLMQRTDSLEKRTAEEEMVRWFDSGRGRDV